MTVANTWLICLVSVFSFILRVEASTFCNATQACPEDKPCCSQYGQCGTCLLYTSRCV